MKILKVKTRKAFYDYMEKNHKNLTEVFVVTKVGNPKNIKDCLSYIDAIEVALCFGFIDSSKKIIDGDLVQRFSPRKKDSYFSELNKARCRRLIKLKDMTEYGLKVIPDLNKEYIFPKYLINKIKKDPIAYKFFMSTPKLYQNIRIYNLDFAHQTNKELFKISFSNFMKKCHDQRMYGTYDDYGRLSTF